MKKIVIFLFFVSLFWGCKNDAFLYEGEPGGVSGLYFLKVTTTSPDGTPLGYTDSISYSFQNDPIEIEIQKVRIPVQLFGMILEEPRPFKLKVIGGTAVEGTDFLPLPKEYIFPAKKANAEAFVEIKRTPVLATESRYLVVELIENEYFQLLLPSFNNIDSRDTLKTNMFKISFTEQIVEMRSYRDYGGRSYFGDWSVKKFHMINAITGWTLKNWQDSPFNNSPVVAGKMPYVATLLRRQLQERADHNDPVMDEMNGGYMQLGPSYRVDYSKYESDEN